MKIRFQKMHGTLNDFVVIGDIDNRITLSKGTIAKLCDRRLGIGADGLIVVRPSALADFFMDYYNSDGSVAEMCGNGIRCVAKYVYDTGLTREMEHRIETRSGVKTVWVEPGEDGSVESVRVEMGFPIFDPERIPVLVSSSEVPVLSYPLEVDGRIFACSFISMGNPHCVVFLDEDVDALPLMYGTAIENNELFPQKTNVEFVRVISRSRLSMRVWERGSGVTLSCGTGACASAVAGILKGLAVTPVAVEVEGGVLQISWKGLDSEVIMSGPAKIVYDGEITV